MTHIKSQLKIIIRYSELIIGGIFLYLSATILVVLLYRANKLSDSNIPIMCTVLTTFFTGALFGSLFCEKPNELTGYLLTPWSLRTTILSKNYATLLIAVLFPLPALVIISFFVHFDLQNYVDAVLYWVTSIPVCMLAGNVISTSRTTLSSTRNAMPLQFLMVSASVIPYAIFKMWLNSASLCIVFSCISIIIWIFYVLPIAEKNIRVNLLKIVEE